METQTPERLTYPIAVPAHPKKAKTKSDPNAPKRACSAFILFSNDERANVKRNHPEFRGADIYRQLGERWGALDADTKARYAALYAENKVKAEDAKRVYAESVVVGLGSPDADSVALHAPKKKAAKTKSDPNAPKSA